MVKNISHLCIDRDTSIAALERAVGLGNGTISRWDKNIPGVDKVKRVADYFRVSVDELLADGKEAR